jgi:acyl-CoA hydrolase/ribosomal protein S18 acetylase RimI-like enzyme
MRPLKESDWPQLILPGNRVFFGSNAACPQALIRSMLSQASELHDIEIVHILTHGGTPWADPQYSDRFTINSFFQGPGVREAVNEGRADYTPCFLSEIPRLFLDNVVPIDVALVQVSPPDEFGYCSLGVGVDVASAACRAAVRVVAQINPRMPRTFGQSFIHRDRITAFLEADEPIPEVAATMLEPEMVQIGRHVAQLVEDGSTLQMGIGKIPDAVLQALSGHRHLGIHTEMFSDGLLAAIESGVVDNSRKTLHPGKIVASFCIGTRRLYDWVHQNPHVEFHPTEYVNSPLVIAQNDRMMAINSALEVDLSGQVAADSVGFRFYSGIGGQVDFIRGASMSRGGKPIIALPSTAKAGEISRIVLHLSEGSGVVTSRGDVHYVVTEFGIATLRGRSIRERALELIQIAHPKFRDALLKGAWERKWVPSYQQAWPKRIEEMEGVETQRVTLKDGERYLVAPLQPSDQRRLQEFFYSHTLETIQRRYGYSVNRMSRERAYELVNIDQSKDLALAVFETQGPREIIHAVGRYYLDESGKSAEAAFVVRESKRRCGMASHLLEAMLKIAKQRGLDYLWGRVRKDNLPMLAVFKRYGGRVWRSETMSFDVEVRVPLSESATAALREAAKPARPDSPAPATKKRGSVFRRKKRE